MSPPAPWVDVTHWPLSDAVTRMPKIERDYCQHYICYQAADQISASAPRIAGLNLEAKSGLVSILKNVKYAYSHI